ncbi:MAG: phosphoribosylglycinamide formyltransferase [Bacteroidota bacterium]|nr:phosphoribosylglycinamide formyltransferase [Bacteroidota bacterium]
MADKLKIAVLASGRGSNFQALLESIESGLIKDAEVVCLISNNSDAGVLKIAKNKNISAHHISRKQFSTGAEFDNTILNVLLQCEVNFIVLAGYMKLLDVSIIKKFQNRIINIHPALLPQFGGKGMYGRFVHDAVIASGEKYSGATVHIVDEKYDNGSIVLQERIALVENETSETLAAKVLEIEHRILPQAVRLFAEGKVEITNGKIKIHHNGK